jgi:hypothetical protein
MAHGPANVLACGLDDAVGFTIDALDPQPMEATGVCKGGQRDRTAEQNRARDNAEQRKNTNAPRRPPARPMRASEGWSRSMRILLLGAGR